MASNNFLLAKLIVLLFCYSWSKANNSIYTRYKIGIELPFLKEEYTPLMTCFYKGQQFRSTGCIEIILSSQEREFYLLITNSLEIPQNCDIDALCIKKDDFHRLWRISSSYEHDTSTNTSHLIWSADEQTAKATQNIPHNTIIIFWNNINDISHIKESRSSTTGPFISLPTLQFRKDISIEDFKKGENYMHAASVDMKFNHVPFCNTTKVNQVAHQTISIPTPTYQI